MKEAVMALYTEVEELISLLEGGPGSGYFGHPGRPGLVGGSKPSDFPEHIKRLKIPPGWTHVQYNPDPDGDLLVKAKDSKGRDQYIYSAKYTASQAEAKFQRVKELADKAETIYAENEKNRFDPDKVEEADCMKLIMDTGIRPGSDTDTLANVKAYGATTLEGQHVISENGKVYLRFIGKKGVSLDIAIDNPSTANMLLARAEAAGKTGKLFDTSADSLLDYSHSLDGGNFKPKDFRTYLGTKLALQEISKMSIPTTQKEYKSSVKAVAKAVSAKLGNTPTVALQYYINPTVFASWRIKQ